MGRPVMRAAFCSQPLFRLGSLSAEAPRAIEDWLSYHLEHFGFNHAEIYDIDGSFAANVNKRWRRRSAAPGGSGQDFTMTYHAKFPANLSDVLAYISRSHPYCAEMHAYTHCLVTHRALSRWVM